MLLALLRWCMGYIEFRMTGGSFERLLTACAKARVVVWAMRRNGDAGYARVRLRDYKKMAALRRKSGRGGRLRAVKRAGLPFLLHRGRRRYGMAAGFAAAALTLYALTHCVWSVQVAGNRRVASAEILAAVQRMGLREGTWRESVDVEAMREKLLLEIPDLAWAAVNLDGTFATIDVSETKVVPPAGDRDIACNVKARSDGRIISVTANEGVTLVAPGDGVTKGQILISGTVQHTAGETTFVHASGTAMAETEHTLSARAPYSEVRTQRTGEIARKRVATLFGLNIPLYLGRTKGPYQADTSQWRLTVGGVQLPFAVTTARFYGIESVPVLLSEEQALDLARLDIQRLQRTQLSGIEILASEEFVKKDAGGVTLTVRCACLEDIGMEEKILINSGG